MPRELFLGSSKAEMVQDWSTMVQVQVQAQVTNNTLTGSSYCALHSKLTVKNVHKRMKKKYQPKNNTFDFTTKNCILNSKSVFSSEDCLSFHVVFLFLETPIVKKKKDSKNHSYRDQFYFQYSKSLDSNLLIGSKKQSSCIPLFSFCNFS